MAEIIGTISGTLWGLPMILTIACCGILFTFGTKFFCFRYIGHIFKYTIGSISKNNTKDKTGVSPFEAACIAIGGGSAWETSPALPPPSPWAAPEPFSGCGPGASLA